MTEGIGFLYKRGMAEGKCVGETLLGGVWDSWSYLAGGELELQCQIGK